MGPFGPTYNLWPRYNATTETTNNMRLCSSQTTWKGQQQPVVPCVLCLPISDAHFNLQHKETCVCFKFSFFLLEWFTSFSAANPPPVLFGKNLFSFQSGSQIPQISGSLPQTIPASALNPSLLTPAISNTDRHQPQLPALPLLCVSFQTFCLLVKIHTNSRPPAQALRNALIQILGSVEFFNVWFLVDASILKLRANCTHKRKQQGCFGPWVLSARWVQMDGDGGWVAGDGEKSRRMHWGPFSSHASTAHVLLGLHSVSTMPVKIRNLF